MTAEHSRGEQGDFGMGTPDESSDTPLVANQIAKDPTDKGQPQTDAESGSSPYATGGGGVTLGHRIAAIYLASLLTGERRAEASELPVRRVSFQTFPEHPVDDLLVEYSSGTSKVTIAIACRATPNFVRSDKQTVKLVSSLLKEIEKFNTDDHQVAVAVAGWRTQWKQLATVCDIARSNANAAFFKASLDVEKRWSKKVRERLDQFLMMVNLATENSKSEAEVFSLAFKLLSRLHILSFAVQSPDERDRTAVATALDAVAADAVDGIILRNRLEVEATRYDATSAVVDLNLLRRDLHTVLETTTTRNTQVWETLADHRRVADASVRTVLGEASTTSDALSISFADRRDDLIASIRNTGTDATALIVSGESGTGKSALTLSCIAQLEEEDPTGFEALVVNFRALPQTGMEFRSVIGASIAEVLAELSAPTRVLVIDAADAAFERSGILLNDLVLAAKQAGVGVVAVCSDAAQEFVNEKLALGFDKGIAYFNMQLLSDADLETVAAHFPLLRTVLRDLPQTSLLRRLVVLDLLARSGIELKSQISEWDCLDLVWKKIVRAEDKPGAGSAEAREQTLLAVAAATLNPSADRQVAAAPDPVAVDKLRRDHLLAPASPYLARPEFAHDEVRRYALAVLLVRAPNMVDTLQASGAPRWTLSAATLACKGQLCAPRANAPRLFDRMVQMFNAFAVQNGPRWSDVPVEAALDAPKAYECLKADFNNPTSPVHLDDVVRIVKQRYQVNGLPDSLVTAPVIQLLLDHAEPWQVSELSFELLAGWLQLLVLRQLPAGNPLRIALRDRLITYWDSFPTLKPIKKDRADNRSVKLGFGSRSRRRRELPYEVTQNEYIECLALLGPDINDQVEQCLLEIADDAPGFLAPAADSPLSAQAIALHDPELLATLMEAYYIDEGTEWDLHGGIRDHQGRWKGFFPPFCQYYYGGFWVLLNFASYKTSIRVLNNILNHGARVRVRPRAGLGGDPFEGTLDHGPEEQHETGAELNLDGTSRFYVGDTHVWSWYRGTSVGPYSGMSALLAMERVAESWLDAQIPPSWIVNALLENCENLAVPGMLYGLLTRHIDKINEELDSFLAEPMVWELEFGRLTGEHSGLAARTDDLKHQERRNWSPREVCATLITRGNEKRVQTLKKVGDLLISNGDRLGVPQEHTKNWAASLDANRYKLTQEDGQLYLQVDPPKELQATQAEFARDQDQVNTGLRLQNRYWGSAKHNADYVPPTSAEIAQDLSTARELLDANNDIMPALPLNAAAHVVRVAVQRAALGDLEALGGETEFVAQLVLQLALAFEASDDQRDEGQYFNLGADRAIAHALPAFLTPALANLLPAVGATIADVEDAGMAVAGKAPLETRLYLTRGCDIVWESPCHGTPCIHKTAISWVLETARGAELGALETHNQRRSRVYIKGDVPTRLQELDGTSIDLTMLNASLRGIGAAAAARHCDTTEAARLLAQFLDVQRRTMVTHSEKRWGVDHQGASTLVAARALLDNYASYRAVQPVLDHLDVLSVDADLLSSFLHSLAAAGAENNRRAQAARDLWPAVFDHALTYASQNPSPYRDHHWGDWAAAALLPEPLSWTQGLYNELAGAPIDWVNAEDLLGLIDQWVPLGRAKTRCVDALIHILRKLPVAEQVTRGLDWITELCSRNGQVVINQSWGSNDWLKGIRSTAEALDELHKWQKLVDAMVVAGNEDLAPYSR